MKTVPFLFILIMFSVSITYSQENSSIIGDAKEIVKLAPGLVIKDVAVLSTLEDRVLYDFVTNEKIIIDASYDDFWGPGGYGFFPITENVMLFSATTNNYYYKIFFYQIGKGARLILSCQKFKGINNVSIMSFFNDTLTFSYDTQGKIIIAQITGDWKSLGLDIPKMRNVADLNMDGFVNSLDLIFFSKEWKNQ